MGSAPAWCYRLAKPFSSGAGSAFLEAKSLAKQGIKAQHKARLFSKGPSKSRHIALTFNDGPNPEVTPGLLKILKAHHVPATFFMIGREALSQVTLAKKVAKDGHEIGNHTMNHVKCSEESERELFRQIQDAQDAIRFATGQEALWFRPPYGDFDEAHLHLPFHNELSTVFWTMKVKDWENDNADTVVKQVKAGLEPGAILALHEKRDCIVDAMEGIISAIKATGLQPVTLSEMFARELPKYR